MPDNNTCTKYWQKRTNTESEFVKNGQTLATLTHSNAGYEILHIYVKPKDPLDQRYTIENSIGIKKDTEEKLLTSATNALYRTLREIRAQIDDVLPDETEDNIRLHAISVLASHPRTLESLTDQMYAEMTKLYRRVHTDSEPNDKQYDDAIWQYVTTHKLLT